MSDSDRLLPISSEGEASLRTSLHSLQSQHPKAPERFAWLGLLPEEEILTPPMMAVWWQMEVSDAQHQLELFCQEGLLLAAAPMTIGEQDYPCYHLHVSFHDVARRLLFGEAEHGLGLSTREAHRVLLERYYDRLPASQEGERSWAQVEEDGYIHDHLTWHIERAEQFEAMFLLLNAETADGKNAWFEAQDRLGKMASYREDVKRSWRTVQRRSQEAAERGEPITTLGLELRHCLILASLNSLPDKALPPELLVIFVREGVWKPRIGLAYVRQLSTLWHRSEAFRALIPLLSAAELQEAVPIARTMGETSQCAEFLLQIAACLPPSEERSQVLEEALSLASQIEDAADRTDVLIGIADCLPPSEEQSRILAEALSVAPTIETDYRTAQALTRIVEIRTANGDIDQALALARKIEDGFYRVQALCRIAAKLPPSAEQSQIVAETFSMAQTMENSTYRANALLETAPLLTITQIREALAVARAMENSAYRAYAITGIAAPLSPSEQREQALAEALAEARTIEETDNRVLVLMRIACALTQKEERWQVLTETLAIVRTIEDAYTRDNALQEIANVLVADGEIEQALEIARTKENDVPRALAIAEIADKLPQSTERSQLFAEALSMAHSIGHSDAREYALTRVAAHLPQSKERAQALAEALAIARTIGDNSSLSRALIEFEKVLAADGGIEQVLLSAQKIRPASTRAETLLSINGRLPRGEARLRVLAEVLRYARMAESAPMLEEVLAQIAQALAAVGDTEQALASARTVDDASLRAYAFTRIAADLPPTEAQARLWAEALSMARQIHDASFRAETLAIIAGHLPPGKEQSQVLADALSSAQTKERFPYHLRPFTEIIKVLVAVGDTEQALLIVRKRQDAPFRNRAFIEIVEGLAAAGDTKQALWIARTIEEYPLRARALTRIAGYLSLKQLSEALGIARKMKDASACVQALTGSVGHLPDAEERSLVLAEALSLARAIGYPDRQALALIQIAACLSSSEERSSLWREVWSAARTMEKGYNEEERLEALTEIACHLPPSEERSLVLAEALSVIRTMQYATSRVQALIAITPHLNAAQLSEAAMITQSFEDAASTHRSDPEMDRVRVLNAIAAQLQRVPVEDFYPLWTAFLQSSVLLDRYRLQEVIAQLHAVLLEKGTMRTLEDLLHALRDVGRWWP